MAEKLYSYADKQVLDEVGSGGGGGGSVAENIVSATVANTETGFYIEIDKTVREISELLQHYGVVYAMNTVENAGARIFRTIPIISSAVTIVKGFSDIDGDGTVEEISFDASSEDEKPRYYFDMG